MTNLKCTRFSSIRNTKPAGTEDLITMLNEIASDKYKIQIEEIRKQENPSKSPLKDKLPLFTPTGIFNYRSMAGLEEYNGIICLDIDSVSNPEELKEKCKKLNYVYSAFITPSGQGLKVLIKTHATPENYRDIESKVASAFQHDTGAIRDNHCKDIARIQFVSHDPEIYINENSSLIQPL
jgi:hypothetical protein